jgi:hypothetical protein
MLHIGDEVPVWWDTEDGRPAGQHKARILAARPYTGPHPTLGYHAILKLAAPTTKRGWMEMTWDGERVVFKEAGCST